MKKRDNIKLTISITQETNKALREYVSKNYPTESFGKMSDIVDTAIQQFLHKQKT